MAFLLIAMDPALLSQTKGLGARIFFRRTRHSRDREAQAQEQDQGKKKMDSPTAFFPAWPGLAWSGKARWHGQSKSQAHVVRVPNFFLSSAVSRPQANIALWLQCEAGRTEAQDPI